VFKVYKRGKGKNWQISYKIGNETIRETTKTDLFCNAIFLCRKIKKDIEARRKSDEMRQQMGEKYLTAEKIMAGKEKPKTSIDGFDMFYLDAKSTPSSCSDGLGVVYVIKSGDRIKIGITQSPRSRLRTIENNTGKSLDVIYLSRQCGNYRDAEQTAHYWFDEQRMVGEWFAIDFRYAVYRLQNIFMDAPPIQSSVERLRQYAKR